MERQNKMLGREKEIVGLKEFGKLKLVFDGDKLPFSFTYGQLYQYKGECKGWCKYPNMRRIAMSLVCESSREHSGEQVRDEEGLNLASAAVPIVKGRTIVYVEGAEYLKATGFVIVACCNEIGSYLIELRWRLAGRMSTLSCWRTQWEGMKDFDR